MSSNVQQTSITAYNEDVKSGKIPSQRRRIEIIIRQQGPLTRREIKNWSDFLSLDRGLPYIPMSSVCGRVRALIDSDLIHVSDHKLCPTTGKKVQVLKYGPEPSQGKFRW